MDELGLRHTLPSPADLHLTDVDARDTVPGGRQVASDGDPASAAEIQHRAACRDPTGQCADPWPVLRLAAVRPVVAEGERVIPAPDQLFGIFDVHAGAR